MDRVQNGYQVYVPPLSHRILRSLGFRGPGPVETPDLPAWKGWVAIETKICFTLGDRIRILFGGNVQLSQRLLAAEEVTDTKTFTAIGVWPGKGP